MIFKINPKKLVSQVQLDISQEDNYLDIFAQSPCGKVGHALGSISKDRLCLCDLKVFDDAPVCYPFAHCILVTLFGSCLQANFRGLGIGSRLLRAFVDEAKKLGIREIWGSVQDGDTRQPPSNSNYDVGPGGTGPSQTKNRGFHKGGTGATPSGIDRKSHN